jgi:purine nucleosidase
MITFPHLTSEERLSRLRPLKPPISMVLDTDTYNEIDDQFALVYALLSEELQVKAVYAAPFHNERSTSPADGMEKSYREIRRILDRLDLAAAPPVFRGAKQFLAAGDKPVESAAAVDLVEQAQQGGEQPLVVVAIGAATNVASALLLDPTLVERIVVVWLGGEPHQWRGPMLDAFNLVQDSRAAGILFDSGVPLVHVPCHGVSERLLVDLEEVERQVKGQGAVGDYLYQIFHDYVAEYDLTSKVIWDIATIGYLIEPDWVPSELIPSPVLLNGMMWGEENVQRHVIREAHTVQRDQIVGDLFH